MARGINRVILVGRLTHDPEVRTFGNGGKVTKLRLACNNSKKNTQTGQWEDVPMYIDCDVFNLGDNGRQADIAEQYMKKGREVAIEGRLELETWDDKTSGQKRSKHKIRVENFQLIGSRDDAGGGGDGGYSGGNGGGNSSGGNRVARGNAAPAPARNGSSGGNRPNSYNKSNEYADEPANEPEAFDADDPEIPF